MEYTYEELVALIASQSMRVQDEEDLLDYYYRKLEELKEGELNGTTKRKE